MPDRFPSHLLGYPVVVSKYLPTTVEVGEEVHHRSLLRRLLGGKMVDLEFKHVPCDQIFLLGEGNGLLPDGTIAVNPDTAAEIRAIHEGGDNA